MVGKVDLIESVDRTELLDAISAASVKAGVTTEILLQINGGKEESKSGYEVESVLSAADYALSLPNLKLRGLMAMLPADKNEQTLREICLQIREKYDIMKTRYESHAQAQIEILSMGMSEDYAIAVACGANEVRLGRILFGERK
ncbi:MAG: alanine racemase [Clostridia bacterium]|nr:alanine racemase [Clostridia bacterium]